MRSFLYLIIGLLVLGGAFLLVPQTNQSKRSQERQSLTDADQKMASATKATIKTEKGEIVLELYPDDAPKTVTNFVTLSRQGYYDNLVFHRVEPGFVVQGGDPKGDGSGGRSIYGETFEDELNAATASFRRGYVEGVLAMANRGPNTNGSQFFITLADQPNLPKKYTIFGRVIVGMEVVKKIERGDLIKTITVSD